MKYNLYIGLVSVCLLAAMSTSCGHRHGIPADNACEIVVRDYEHNTFNTQSMFSEIDTLPLLPKKGCLLSQVKDLCLNQQFIYVLDDNQSLSCFDRISGKMHRYIHSVGHGAGEYMMPKAICAYADEIYLLHERACNVYDVYLNFKRKFKIDLTALDFIKVEDGFLFCNLTPSEDVKRLVYTDNDGKIINSYIPSKLIIDVVASTKCFFSDEASNVYFTEPTSDELYLWNNRDIETCYRSIISNSYDGHPQATSEREDYAYNTKWFKLGNKVINSFLYLGERFYNVYDETTSTCVCGQVNVNESIPFAPRWQWKNCLYGVYPKYDETLGEERLILTKFCL